MRYTGPPGFAPPGTGNLALEVGLLNIDTMPADIWQLGWSFYPLLAGEVTRWESDIPGTVSSLAYISFLHIQSIDTGTWRDMPCYLIAYTQASNYHVDNSPGCTNVYVWTQ